MFIKYGQSSSFQVSRVLILHLISNGLRFCLFAGLKHFYMSGDLP